MKAIYNNDREAALRYKELGGILDFPYDMPSILCVTMEQNYAVLQLLIDLNENINARSRLLGKISALHYAVQKNDIQAVNILLAAPNINVNIQDSQECTPLHYAVQVGNLGHIQSLIQAGADDTIKGAILLRQPKMTPLELATYLDSSSDITKYLLGLELIKYVQTNSLKEVEKILSLGANPKCVDAKGNTPLHYTVERYISNLPIARLLIKHQCNINHKNHENLTILHKAINWNHVDMIELLMANGAQFDINHCDLYQNLSRSKSYFDENDEERKKLIDGFKNLISYGATFKESDIKFLSCFSNDKYNIAIKDAITSINQLESDKSHYTDKLLKKCIIKRLIALADKEDKAISNQLLRKVFNNCSREVLDSVLSISYFKNRYSKLKCQENLIKTVDNKQFADLDIVA